MNRVRLDDIAEIQTGLSYRRYLQEDGIKFNVIVQRSIQKDGILKDFEKISLSPENVRPHHLTKRGDVLMKMPYPYDVVCVGDQEGLVVSDRIAIIRPDHHHDSSFIAHLLTNAHVQKQLHVLSTKERMPHASLRQIKELELVVPDLETQKKYGRLLDTINEKIYEDRKVVKYDQDLKEGILNRIWGEF